MCHEVNSTALIGIFQIFPNVKNLAINVNGLYDLALSTEDLETLHEKFNELRSFVVRIEDANVVEVVVNVIRNITALYICEFKFNCDLEALGPACLNSEFLAIEKVEKELKLEKIFEFFEF